MVFYKFEPTNIKQLVQRDPKIFVLTLGDYKTLYGSRYFDPMVNKFRFRANIGVRNEILYIQEISQNKIQLILECIFTNIEITNSNENMFEPLYPTIMHQ